MARLSQEYAFERGLFPLGDRGAGTFQPLKDAVNRWAVDHPEMSPLPGVEWQVLYETIDGKFFLFRYSCCHKAVQSKEGQSSEIWIGIDPPRIWRLTDDQAVYFLQQVHQEIPASLKDVSDAIVNGTYKSPIRPLSHWEGHEMLSVRMVDHPPDVLTYAENLVTAGYGFVDAAERWSGKRAEIGHEIREFVLSLFATFRIDPNKWYGDPSQFPPTQVSILDLHWPPGANAIRSSLRGLRTTLEGPMTLLLRHIDQPCVDESVAARTAVINALPKIKEQILSIRNQLRDIRQAAEQAAAAQAERPAVPRPTETEFILYQIHVTTGMKQSQVAQEYTRRMGLPMEQGRVSKAVGHVKEWVEAGNVAPVTALPDPRKAVPVDPQMLDLGPRHDGQTPAQRGKCDSE